MNVKWFPSRLKYAYENWSVISRENGPERKTFGDFSCCLVGLVCFEHGVWICMKRFCLFLGIYGFSHLALATVVYMLELGWFVHWMLCHRRFSMVRKVAGCGTCTGLGITATVFGDFNKIIFFTVAWPVCSLRLPVRTRNQQKGWLRLEAAKPEKYSRKMAYDDTVLFFLQHWLN